MSAASETSPITSAPRNGALQPTAAGDGGGTGATLTLFSATTGEGAVIATVGDGGAAVVTLTLLSATTGDGAVTATDRLPLPLILPGMYSSSTAWKLVPPKPNALTPTRRTLSAGTGHGIRSVLA